MTLSDYPSQIRHSVVKRFYKKSNLIKYINDSPFDYIENGDILNQVDKILRLFGINSHDLGLDASYVVNFIKLNKDKLESDESDFIEPELNTYEVPYYVVETEVKRTEFKSNIESYGDANDAINIFKELEYDGAIDLWSGQIMDEQSLDSSLDDWDIRTREVRKK